MLFTIKEDVRKCVCLLCCWYLEFGRKGEREEQDECFSLSASPQQPKARKGECRGWETGQQPLEEHLPQERGAQRVERIEERKRTETGARTGTEKRRQRGQTRKVSGGETEKREKSEGGEEQRAGEYKRGGAPLLLFEDQFLKQILV